MPTKRTQRSLNNGRSQTGIYNKVGYQGASEYSRNSGNYTVAAQKKMSRGKKAAIILISVLAVLIIGTGTAFAFYVNYINDQLRGNHTDEELLAISDALGDYGNLNDTFYMMLIGSDERTGKSNMGARSDTNIVARVDPKAHQVTLLSIPRDTKIEIPNHGTQKFNAAFAFEGPAGTIKAAEKLLGVDITHYAEVNFDELANLVDAVGGITVENESRINNWKCDDGDGNHYIIEAGEQTLNGGQALTFARNRDYPDGDFTRQKHQRMVIEAIAESVLEAPLGAIPGIIEAAVKCVTTDLNVMDIIGLAQNFASSDDELVIYSCMLPSYTQMINGISFVIMDDEKTQEMLKVFIAGGDPGEYKSLKGSAPAITTNEVDTTNVLLYDDDDEVTNGHVSANKNPTTTNSSSGGSSSGGTTSGGSEQNTGGSSSSGTTTTPTDPGGTVEPTDPDIGTDG